MPVKKKATTKKVIKKNTNVKTKKNPEDEDSFVEIAPLNYEFNYENQKELSSIPISAIKFGVNVISKLSVSPVESFEFFSASHLYDLPSTFTHGI